MTVVLPWSTAARVSTIWKEIAEYQSNDYSSSRSLARAHALLGALRRDTNPAESAAAYREAITIYPKESQSSREATELASYHSEMALPLRKLGRLGEAREHLDEALSIEDSIPAPKAFTRNELGDLLLESGEREQALHHYRAALTLAEQAVVKRPQDMQCRRELADCYERLGNFHARAGNGPEALAWYRKSVDLWNNWTRWGVSSVYNERRAVKAAQLVASVAVHQTSTTAKLRVIGHR